MSVILVRPLLPRYSEHPRTGGDRDSTLSPRESGLSKLLLGGRKYSIGAKGLLRETPAPTVGHHPPCRPMGECTKGSPPAWVSPFRQWVLAESLLLPLFHPPEASHTNKQQPQNEDMRMKNKQHRGARARQGARCATPNSEVRTPMAKAWNTPGAPGGCGMFHGA